MCQLIYFIIRLHRKTGGLVTICPVCGEPGVLQVKTRSTLMIGHPTKGTTLNRHGITNYRSFYTQAEQMQKEYKRINLDGLRKKIKPVLLTSFREPYFVDLPFILVK